MRCNSPPDTDSYRLLVTAPERRGSHPQSWYLSTKLHPATSHKTFVATLKLMILSVTGFFSTGVHTLFQKPTSHRKILGTRRVT